MQKNILLITLVLSALSFRNMDTPQVRYIEMYKDLAISEMHRTGVPASIKLAQAIVESDSGQSLLAGRANNHFGIKCKSYWEGGRYFYADDDRDQSGRLIPSCFRRYESATASYTDHSDFLKNSPRYAELFELATTDYEQWALGLKKCGYATDRSYAVKLIKSIETLGLDRFDAEVR
ncbi:MAG: glucosaminidase domain-containing protein [Saprospiraceae bacterium]|nr:glucosaminidase domain-containing protein [Saprospiraceae bacterium]